MTFCGRFPTPSGQGLIFELARIQLVCLALLLSLMVWPADAGSAAAADLRKLSGPQPHAQMLQVRAEPRLSHSLHQVPSVVQKLPCMQHDFETYSSLHASPHSRLRLAVGIRIIRIRITTIVIIMMVRIIVVTKMIGIKTVVQIHWSWFGSD